MMRQQSKGMTMRAVIYARYSSDLQREASIDDQTRECQKCLQKNDWTLVQTYHDRAISGASLKNRPGFQALLDDGRLGKFDIVISESLDRLSRDQEDVAGIYKRLQYAGVQIFTLSEGYVSEIHIGLKGTMNALFLKDLANKIRRGQRGRVEVSRSPGGLAYGYAVVPEIDERGVLNRGGRKIIDDKAKIVLQIYKEYCAGKSPRAIAQSLNAESVPSPRGGLWNASTINGNRGRGLGILQNEIYRGVLVYNRVTMVKDPETGKRLSRLNPAEDWLRAPVPHLRIVSDELWNQAQAIKSRYSTQSGQKARRPRRLLSGLLHCGDCGGSYTISRPGKYGCSTHREKGTCSNGRQIAINKLEQRVLSGLKTNLLQPELVAEFCREFERALSGMA